MEHRAFVGNFFPSLCDDLCMTDSVSHYTLHARKRFGSGGRQLYNLFIILNQLNNLSIHWIDIDLIKRALF